MSALSLITLLSLASWAAAAPCTRSTLEMLSTDYTPGEKGLEVYSENAYTHHVSCYVVGTRDTSGANATVTANDTASMVLALGRIEVQRQFVGIASHDPVAELSDDEAERGSYTVPGQHHFGVIKLNLGEVNGHVVPEEGPTTTDLNAENALCDTDTESVQLWQEKKVKIQSEYPGYFKFTAYMFRNDKEWAAEGLQHTMTLSTMGGCRLEIVYEITVNTAGDTSLRMQVVVETPRNENGVNAALTMGEDSDANSVSVYAPIDVLSDAVGMTENEYAEDGTRGSMVGDTSDVAGKRKLVEMSLTFICKETGLEVDSSHVSFTWGDDTLQVTIAQAGTGGCNTLYWDPLVRPLASKSEGYPLPLNSGLDSAATTCVTRALSLLSLLAALVVS